MAATMPMRNITTGMPSTVIKMIIGALLFLTETMGGGTTCIMVPHPTHLKALSLFCSPHFGQNILHLKSKKWEFKYGIDLDDNVGQPLKNCQE
jgi:hypothetical protein